jgi:hypothetical protein
MTFPILHTGDMSTSTAEWWVWRRKPYMYSAYLPASCFKRPQQLPIEADCQARVMPAGL